MILYGVIVFSQTDYIKTGFQGGVLFFTVIIITAIILSLLIAGIYYLALKLVRNKKPSLKVLFSGFSNFVSVWMTFYFSILLVICGIFLFIISSFVW